MTESVGRPEVFTTSFVAAPGKLAEAELLYARRVAALPATLGNVVSVDEFAVPGADEFLLWDLRATALYEGISEVESLALFQLSCAVENATEETAEHLFFCGPEERDPFPSFVSRGVPGEAPDVSSVPATPELSDGTWLVTLYSLHAGALAEVVSALQPELVGTPAEVLEPHDVFGRLAVAAIRRHPEVFAPGLPHLRQRLVVRHVGAPTRLDFPAVHVAAERLGDS